MVGHPHRNLPESIRHVVASTRSSVETATLTKPAVFDQLLIKQLLMNLEAARLSLGPMALRAPLGFREAVPRLLEFVTELNKILFDENLRRVAERIRFVLLSPGTPVGSQVLTLFPHFKEKPTLITALDALVTMANMILMSAPETSDAIELLDVRGLIPEQRISPIQFDIKDGRLSVSHQADLADDQDEQNVESARGSLLESGARVIRQLQSSNCDKRLVETISYVQSQLENDLNAIRIGLANAQAEALYTAFTDELPTAVAALLQAHIQNIYLFVRQFPNWNRFVQNSVEVSIEPSDIRSIAASTDALVAELESAPELVDPEVPRLIRYVKEFVEKPSTSGKRAAFALVRTIENLVSSIYAYVIDFADQIITKTIKLSSAAIGASVAVWIGLAASGSDSLGPVVSKIPELSWIKTVSDYLKRRVVDIAGKDIAH